MLESSLDAFSFQMDPCGDYVGMGVAFLFISHHDINYEVGEKKCQGEVMSTKKIMTLNGEIVR